jgi:endonuclease/exonuclease/phosphatase (EEP) superfamily protein YafD
MTHDRTRLLHITTVPVSFTFLHGPIDFVIARGVKVHALSSPGPLSSDDFFGVLAWTSFPSSGTC